MKLRAGSDGVADVQRAIRAALEDRGPAVEPVAPSTDDPAEDRRATPSGAAGGAERIPEGTVLVLRTSGSTGAPRRVALSGAALRASAEATAERLGGPGQWLLALPVHHVAGAQVLVRSVLAGTEPVVMDLTHGFRPEAFERAADRLTGRRYTSLVPTQLVRLLDAGGGPLRALARFDAVLVGGAALPTALRQRAEQAGVAVVTTYGMTETCGGCIYDGVPLRGVQVALDEEGRVLIAGRVLATGHLDSRHDEGVFFDRPDGRWLRTSDVGRWDDGRLTVLGRVDDVINSGGVKVPAGAVAEVVHELPGIAHVCVLGLPHPHWGEQVTAVVELRPGATPPDLDAVREHVRHRLGPAAAPGRLVTVDRIPMLGIGKVDRAAVRALLG